MLPNRATHHIFTSSYKTIWRFSVDRWTSSPDYFGAEFMRENGSLLVHESVPKTSQVCKCSLHYEAIRPHIIQSFSYERAYYFTEPNEGTVWSWNFSQVSIYFCFVYRNILPLNEAACLQKEAQKSGFSKVSKYLQYLLGKIVPDIKVFYFIRYTFCFSLRKCFKNLDY